MTDNRNLSKTLSTLTLLVVGASAGSALANPASTAPSADQSLSMATSMTSLNALAMAEFEESAKSSNLLAVSDGHHDDSIGSHHHHSIVDSAAPAQLGSDAGQFDV